MKNHKIKTTIRLSKAYSDALLDLSKNLCCSRSELIRDAVKHYFAFIKPVEQKMIERKKKNV
ncbi:MAG: hypothetical protein ACFFE4_00565 [Candidatus Thorarchaeota archaeon]